MSTTAERMREVYHARKAERICVDCTRPAHGQRVRCILHLQIRNLRMLLRKPKRRRTG
jgi:hypothetical protein